MKKIFLIIFAIIIGTTTAEAQPWWKTALVDGAGALGGAGSVMSFTGGIAATTPIGWVGVGAGASIAYAGNATPSKTKVKNNSNNPFDHVGIRHNLIVKDFHQTRVEYSDEKFIDFIEQNKSKYGIEENRYITVEYLREQGEKINSLKSNEDFINFVLNELPKEVDKNEFANFLNSVGNAKTLEKAIEKILNYENDLAMTEMEDVAKNNIFIFLTTLRNSTTLWFN